MPYTIHGHVLEEVDKAKYLGVNIQKNLSWNQHINQIANKANNTIAFLQRNLGKCPQKAKEACFKTLARPMVEYASVIWDPFTEENIKKLEMVQRRGARFFFGDYRRTSSVTTMLNQLQWTSLQERRAQTRTVMMYRIVYHLVDIPTTYLTPTIAVRGHTEIPCTLCTYHRVPAFIFSGWHQTMEHPAATTG